MSTGALLSNNSISDLNGYAIFADARLGSNGDSAGDSELAVGSDPETCTCGRDVWGTVTDAGLDSGSVSTELTIGSGGSVEWQVAGSSPSPLTYDSSGFTQIHTIDIRALTQANAMVSWESIYVQFYKNGAVTDTYSASAGPSVDDRGDESPPPSEQILEITSAYEDNDAVVIQGDFRLAYPGNITPCSTDLAAQIFVFDNGQVDQSSTPSGSPAGDPGGDPGCDPGDSTGGDPGSDPGDGSDPGGDTGAGDDYTPPDDGGDTGEGGDEINQLVTAKQFAAAFSQQSLSRDWVTSLNSSAAGVDPWHDPDTLQDLL